MRLIVTSQQDLAGRNIYRELASGYGFKKRGEFEGQPVYERGDVWLIATEKSQVRASHLDAFFSPDYYVFASRHRSTSERKTLTVHTPGNLSSQAELGGRGRELALCEPSAVKVALNELKRIRDMRNLDYVVSLEATHHGPTELTRPVLFVEVGSTPREWEDEEAIRAVAQAVLKAAENRASFEAGVGIGGNHYAPLHTKAVLETDVAIGHIIPTYAIDELDVNVFREAVVKSGASFGFLDWKGMKKPHREKILSLVDEVGLSLKRGRDLRREEPSDATFQVDRELLEMAWRSDARRLEDQLSSLGCGFIKRGNGISNFLRGREECKREVIVRCLQILGDKGDLSWDGRELTLTLKVKKFSPEKARKFGIEPGPLYAKLAGGEEVRIAGGVVTPEMVREVVQKRIKIRDAYTAQVIRGFLELDDKRKG